MKGLMITESVKGSFFFFTSAFCFKDEDNFHAYALISFTFAFSIVVSHFAHALVRRVVSDMFMLRWLVGMSFSTQESVFGKYFDRRGIF